MDKRTMDITLPQAPEGCGVMCLSASDDPVILSCNATAAEMIGISSDAGARKLFELVRIDDQYELNAQLRTARSGRRAGPRRRRPGRPEPRRIRRAESRPAAAAPARV